MPLHKALKKKNNSHFSLENLEDLDLLSARQDHGAQHHPVDLSRMVLEVRVVP